MRGKAQQTTPDRTVRQEADVNLSGTTYDVTLSCGCVREYSSLCHPFPGALLACPAHGDVRSLATERTVE